MITGCLVCCAAVSMDITSAKPVAISAVGH
jgi:hypothetical protein